VPAKLEYWPEEKQNLFQIHEKEDNVVKYSKI
jgi:hypothetical protein